MSVKVLPRSIEREAGAVGPVIPKADLSEKHLRKIARRLGLKSVSAKVLQSQADLGAIITHIGPSKIAKGIYIGSLDVIAECRDEAMRMMREEQDPERKEKLISLAGALAVDSANVATNLVRTKTVGVDSGNVANGAEFVPWEAPSIHVHGPTVIQQNNNGNSRDSDIHEGSLIPSDSCGG